MPACPCAYLFFLVCGWFAEYTYAYIYIHNGAPLPTTNPTLKPNNNNPNPQDWILRVATRPVDGTGQAPNVCVIELGGTLGDIESMPFVEALRQLQDKVGFVGRVRDDWGIWGDGRSTISIKPRNKQTSIYRTNRSPYQSPSSDPIIEKIQQVGYKNCCFLHVSMVPTVGSEQKTKPTQHSVRQVGYCADEDLHFLIHPIPCPNTHTKREQIEPPLHPHPPNNNTAHKTKTKTDARAGSDTRLSHLPRRAPAGARGP